MAGKSARVRKGTCTRLATQVGSTTSEVAIGRAEHNVLDTYLLALGAANQFESSMTRFGLLLLIHSGGLGSTAHTSDFASNTRAFWEAEEELQNERSEMTSVNLLREGLESCSNSWTAWNCVQELHWSALSYDLPVPRQRGW